VNHDTPSSRPLSEALQNIENAMPHFSRWLYSIVRNDLGERVLDAGAGIGTYTFLMAQDQRSVVALEYDAAFVDQLQRRFEHNDHVSIVQGDLGNARGLPPFQEVDSVLCLNALEHIGNDLKALSNMRQRTRSGGKLVILVPAYRWLFNRMDEAVGHHRRYGRDEFLKTLSHANWLVERCFRINAFGIPGWFVAGTILRRNAPGGNLTRLYDRLVPAFSLLERTFVRGLVGLSLVAVCRRDD